jgi:hypothetical protein
LKVQQTRQPVLTLELQVATEDWQLKKRFTEITGRVSR